MVAFAKSWQREGRYLKGASNEPARGAAMTSGPEFVTARLTPR